MHTRADDQHCAETTVQARVKGCGGVKDQGLEATVEGTCKVLQCVLGVSEANNG